MTTRHKRCEIAFRVSPLSSKQPNLALEYQNTHARALHQEAEDRLPQEGPGRRRRDAADGGARRLRGRQDPTPVRAWVVAMIVSQSSGWELDLQRTGTADMQSDWPFRLPGQVQVRHEFTRVGARAAKKGGREKTIKVCWWRFTNYSYTKREHNRTKVRNTAGTPVHCEEIMGALADLH